VRRLLVLPLLALVLVGAKCEPPPPDCSTTGVSAHRDLRYATSPGTAARMQSLDLYVPIRDSRCAATPLLVFVHGGGFVTGDKANRIADKVDLFTGEGWAFASVNYRLVGDPGSGPTNGRYPAAEQDVAAALGYLRARAGTDRVDPQHVMLLGHSAGAFLVSLVSTDERFVRGAGLDLSDIACTASLDTTYDIAAQIASGGSEELMYRNAFGDDPAVWAQASPPNNVAPGKGIPDFHIVTRGQADRRAQSQAFGAALRAAGVEATVQWAAGLSHEDVNLAVGHDGDTVITPPLLSFYRSCVT
jgi:acetyl esterase/lipase